MNENPSSLLPHHVIAVWGSQSSGKTTLAANLAVLLSDAGFMTCLVSANDHGELQTFFGVCIPKGKGMHAALTNGRNVRESLIEVRHNLCVLEAEAEGDAYDLNMVGIPEDDVKTILESLRDQFAYVIIDCTPYKENIINGAGIVQADKVVVCIPHRASAVMWHIANRQFLDAVADKTIYVDVENSRGGCNMDKLLEGIHAPERILRVPYVDNAFNYENRNRTIVSQSGKSEGKYKNQLLKLMNAIIDNRIVDKSLPAKQEKKGREKRRRKGDDD